MSNPNIVIYEYHGYVHVRAIVVKLARLAKEKFGATVYHRNQAGFRTDGPVNRIMTLGGDASKQIKVDAVIFVGPDSGLFGEIKKGYGKDVAFARCEESDPDKVKLPKLDGLKSSTDSAVAEERAKREDAEKELAELKAAQKGSKEKADAPTAPKESAKPSVPAPAG